MELTERELRRLATEVDELHLTGMAEFDEWHRDHLAAGAQQPAPEAPRVESTGPSSRRRRRQE